MEYVTHRTDANRSNFESSCESNLCQPIFHWLNVRERAIEREFGDYHAPFVFPLNAPHLLDTIFNAFYFDPFQLNFFDAFLCNSIRLTIELTSTIINRYGDKWQRRLWQKTKTFCDNNITFGWRNFKKKKKWRQKKKAFLNNIYFLALNVLKKIHRSNVNYWWKWNVNMAFGMVMCVFTSA